ncbi:MAG: Gfo/Idh/MocA family oxidoreductase [Clostridia bacterium]|nr:Gfo/Idh/MocA family oxidoreductase [Clostridia bacterium]
MKTKIKIGYVGVGRRGLHILENCFIKMNDVEITVICENVDKRIEMARKVFAENQRPMPKFTKCYDDILTDPEIDAVVIMTGWDSRPKMAKAAMLAGKYTAIEVGCAETLDECFELISVYEQTGTPLMMLENCCYGRREMLALNLVKQGLLGELVHCTGAYSHYLNSVELFAEMLSEKEKAEGVTHYRLRHYIEKNRENYPTHELGPICKVLGINRGNRIIKLSSFASKAVGIKSFAEEKFGKDSEYAKIDYKQGDIINTIMTCDGGETISITLDTTVPRAYYSRNFSVRGTKGMMSEERLAVFLEGMEEPVRDNEEEMYEKYDHPLHAEYEKVGARGGHGGMDWLVCRAFVEAVKNGTNTPIDAYDTVTWLAVGALSEQSIKSGGMPVDFPDFTNGKWQNREPAVRGKYCLDEICVDEKVRIVNEG